jgi:hypothetical protein
VAGAGVKVGITGAAPGEGEVVIVALWQPVSKRPVNNRSRIILKPFNIAICIGYPLSPQPGGWPGMPGKN